LSFLEGSRELGVEVSSFIGREYANSKSPRSHIIILVPYELLTSPPSWLTSAFTVSPGGRHADNRTENRLILLADGSYIELIAFINDDPALREGHWWVSGK
jgi:hypothetical protein